MSKYIDPYQQLHEMLVKLCEIKKRKNNGDEMSKYIDESHPYQQFHETLDELYELYGIKKEKLLFHAIDVLKDVDPIACREEFLNWLDSEGEK